MEFIETDVLIIGSGIAGLQAAIEISRSGKSAILVSKSAVGKANNTYLAGGLFTVSHNDFDMQSHYEKTLNSGGRLNRRTLVKRFVVDAPGMIEELQKQGLRGKFVMTGFATRGNSFIGGPKINLMLVSACHKAGVKFVEGVMISDLLIRDNVCHGAFGFHKRTGDLYAFNAGCVILATGGAGAIYSDHDNAPGMTGDGYILALRASLELVDMEFVQFYPLVYASKKKGRMIIPAALADLGVIRNRLGENLKEKYELREKPIAIVSRDRFAQALFREIQMGNDVDGALLLDLQDVDDSLIPGSERLKTRLKKLIGYDRKPVTIAPACHHTMGGLVIDEAACTEIDQLYAAGEVVGGIHGANRMGGNALSEALVFGSIAGCKAVEKCGSRLKRDEIASVVRDSAERTFYSRIDKGSTSLSTATNLMNKIGYLLWKRAGILRNGSSLRTALEEIEEILVEIRKLRASNAWELCKISECSHAAIISYAITLAALERKESRGSHYREDYPVESDLWTKNIYLKMSGGTPMISRVCEPEY